MLLFSADKVWSSLDNCIGMWEVRGTLSLMIILSLVAHGLLASPDTSKDFLANAVAVTKCPLPWMFLIRKVSVHLSRPWLPWCEDVEILHSASRSELTGLIALKTAQ